MDFSQECLRVDSSDRVANLVVDKISKGEDIPNDIYPFYILNILLLKK